MPVTINPEITNGATAAATLDTIVIGGGIIGVCIALSLQQAGQQVLLIERQAIASGASGGNAGHIGSEQIAPIASLGIVKDLPKMLLDPLGPVRIDFRYRQLAAADIPVQWLNQADLQTRLPLLTDNHRGGLFYPTTAHVICPKSVCEALHARFVAAGGLTHFATVNSIGESENHVHIRIDNDDKPLHSRQAVIATGINSIDLVKQSSGIRVPLKDERGYHLMTQIPKNGEHGLLDAPVISMDKRFIMTPMQHGLRLSGMVEFSGTKAAPNWRRAHNFLPLANHILKTPLVYNDAEPWFGRRPTLPDSLPVIDRLGRIGYAFGHQHLGLTQAAVTARWITQLMTEQNLSADLQPYRLQRFK